MIKIHPLSQPDLPSLKLLYEDAFGGMTDLKKMEETFEKTIDDPNHIVLVAKSDDQVVGSVLGVICHELIGQGTPFMVLEDVAVATSHRRQGIAKKLMLSIEEIAKEHKCNMILFVSSAHRDAAHKVYESLGYGVDKVNGYRKRLT